MLFLCVLTVVSLFDTASARAQSLRFSQTVLDDYTGEVSIFPNAYYTPDPSRQFSTEKIIERYNNNIRGLKMESKWAELSYKAHGHWFIFEVVNNTDKTEWLFDFGDTNSRRTGFVSRFFLVNGRTSETIADYLSSEQSLLHSAQVPVTIPAQQSSFFVLYAQPLPDMPTTFPLMLKSIDHMVVSEPLEMAVSQFVGLIVFSAVLFFILLSFQRRGWPLLFLALLYACFAGWFCLQNVTFLIANPVINIIVSSSVLVLPILSLLVSWGFFKHVVPAGRQNFLLLGILAVVVVSVIVFSMILPQGMEIRPIILVLPALLTFMTLTGMSLSQSTGSQTVNALMGGAWFLLFVGFAINWGIPYIPFSLGGWIYVSQWIAISLAFVCFALAALSRFRLLHRKEIAFVVQTAKKAQMAVREKQNKETDDQARLMRVIEREREIMEELRQKDALRTEEMRKAKEAADEANAAKSAFLAVVSHEIRTPMTGIMGMIRLLLNTQLTKEQSDYSKTIQDSGDAMLALLNDILDFSKIENDALDLEIIDFDLNRMINGVIMLMSGHASQKGIELVADVDPHLIQYVKGDPTRIRQVLLNLVGNAIKFTSSGQVTLHVQSVRGHVDAARHAGKVPIYFAVEDTGIGISEKDQDKLFTPFEQANASVTRKFGGTGLGLAICKRLVEAMGSHISLTSIEGRGTTFYFTIFLEESSSDEVIEDLPNAKQFEDEGIHRHRILVVDDNEINRKVIEGMLTRRHHELILCENAEEALEAIEMTDFDIVLMDIELPGTSGLEAAHQIRAMQAASKASTPILALTGHTDDKTREDCMQAGMNDLLTKPIDPDQMDRLISKYARISDLGEGDDNTGKMVEETVLFPEEELDADSFLEAHESADAFTPENIDKWEDENELSDQDSFEVAEPMIQDDIEVAENESDQIFDESMLATLKESVGAEQMGGLVDGLFEHNEIIIASLTDALASSNFVEIKDRGHEMKGMCGNFGLTKLSSMGGQLEKLAAKDEPDTDTISGLINALPQVQAESKEQLDTWLKS